MQIALNPNATVWLGWVAARVGEECESERKPEEISEEKEKKNKPTSKNEKQQQRASRGLARFPSLLGTALLACLPLR